MNFEAIRKQYNIPATKGMRIDVRGQMATITGVNGYRLLARFDDTDATSQIHPVLGVTYPKPGELYPKGSRAAHLSLVPDDDDGGDWSARRKPGRVPKARIDDESDLELAPDDPRHGTVEGYRKYKCKCEPCKAAWRERCREFKAARLAKALDPDDPRHGTPNFYTNYDCRCRPCTDAVVMADPRHSRGAVGTRPKARRPRSEQAQAELLAAHAPEASARQREMAS